MLLFFSCSRGSSSSQRENCAEGIAGDLELQISDWGFWLTWMEGVGLLPAAEGPWLVLWGMCARMGLYIQPTAAANPIGCSYRDFIVSALDTSPSLGTLVFKRSGGWAQKWSKGKTHDAWRGSYKCGRNCRMNEKLQSDSLADESLCCWVFVGQKQKSFIWRIWLLIILWTDMSTCSTIRRLIHVKVTVHLLKYCTSLRYTLSISIWCYLWYFYSTRSCMMKW